MGLTQPKGLDVLHDLTHREGEVLRLMSEGSSNEAIARRLGVSARTVETHINNIFAKLALEPTIEEHRRVKAVLTYLGHSQRPTWAQANNFRAGTDVPERRRT